MAGNSNLSRAKEAKNDEFYTQLRDIELEMRHYKEHFKGKTVFCNCDDPYESNFFRYFAMNFNYLGLKKLISTCYVSSPLMYTQLSLFDDMEYSYPDPQTARKRPYKVEITEVSDENGDGAFDLDDIKHLLRNKKNVCSILEGDGDFRSEECEKLLQEADIVVTNPPFSLFREYVAQLIRFDKKFIIIGNQNAITYKEIFPLLKEDKMWLGSQKSCISLFFEVPESYDIPESAHKVCVNTLGKEYCEQHRMTYMRTACWFTNLDIAKRHEQLVLWKPYSTEDYCKYDNYDAINVDKTDEIPCDYYGVMGVPITFLYKYSPDQFEIIGNADANVLPKDWRGASKQIVEDYYAQGNKGQISEGWRNPIFYDNHHKVIAPYKRILIRRKEQK